MTAQLPPEDLESPPSHSNRKKKISSLILHTSLANTDTYQGPDSLCFRLCRPYNLFCNYSPLPLEHKTSQRLQMGVAMFQQNCIKWTFFHQIWPTGYSLLPRSTVALTHFQTSCKRHHTPCILLQLSFFAQHYVFDISPCYICRFSSVISITRNQNIE